MKPFNDIESIWKQQKENSVPDVALIITKAKKEQKIIVNKIIFQVLSLLVTVPVILWVLVANPFQKSTTFIGVAIVLFDIIGFSILRLYQMYQMKKIHFTAAPKQVLDQLEHYFVFQQLLSTKIMFVYFLLLNLGLGLYFIEVMALMPIFAVVISLSVYIGWLLFAYFVIGKKQKRKENERIQVLLENAKALDQMS